MAVSGVQFVGYFFWKEWRQGGSTVNSLWSKNSDPPRRTNECRACSQQNGAFLLNCQISQQHSRETFQNDSAQQAQTAAFMVFQNNA